MWWCIYVRSACATATGVEADASPFPLRETPSLGIANNEQPKESLWQRKKQYLATRIRNLIGLAARVHKTWQRTDQVLGIVDRAASTHAVQVCTHVCIKIHSNFLPHVGTSFLGKCSECWVTRDRTMKKCISQPAHLLGLFAFNQSSLARQPQSYCLMFILRSWCNNTIHSFLCRCFYMSLLYICKFYRIYRISTISLCQNQNPTKTVPTKYYHHMWLMI